MKYRGILAIVLMVMVAVPAMGGDLFTVGNTTGYSVVPARGGQPTIVSLSFTGGAATVDGIVYVGDDTTVLSVAGKASTATTFIVDSCTGMDDDDTLVIQQKPGGTPIEAAVMSSCVGTTGVLTVSAGTANAFNGTAGFRFFEMQALTTVANVGTTLTYPPSPIWGGVKDKPVAFWLNGTGGTIHYMSVEWR